MSAWLLSARPRKLLGWKCPAELFLSDFDFVKYYLKFSGLDAEGDELAVCLVEGDGGLDVDVGEAVAIGHQERVFAFEVLCDAAQAASCARVVAGVDQGDAPGLGDGVVHGHLVVGDVEGDVGGVQEVVGEVLLDDVALVTEADDKVVYSLLGVELEDVPKDGLAADLDHGLGAERGFFTETRTETAGEDDRFHVLSFVVGRMNPTPLERRNSTQPSASTCMTCGKSG